MPDRFPPLAPQQPIRSRRSSAPIRVMTHALPQISLPWLEIGLTVALFLVLRLS